MSTVALVSWGHRVVSALASASRRGRARASAAPVCRVTLDLRGVPWGADPVAASALLRRQPGVLDVQVDGRRRRAVVLHDARTSLPQLWNWLQAQAGAVGEPPGHEDSDRLP